MILKLLVFLSLLPLVVAVFAGMRWGKNWLAKKGSRELGIDSQSLLRRINTFEDAPTPVIKKRVWGVPVVRGELHFTEEEASGKSASALGRCVFLAGLGEMATTAPGVMKLWRSARTFGAVGPPFIALVLVFAVFAAKLSATVALYLFIITLGLAALFSLLQITMLRAAAKFGISRLEKAGVFRSFDDEVLVGDAALAWAWTEVLPLSLSAVLKPERSKHK